MSDLVNRLANLTAIRDRDALDIALVNAINDLLQPLSSTICRRVGEAGTQRWLTSAKLLAGQTVPTFDSAWSPADLLPLLASHPLRQQAVASQQVQQEAGQPNIAIFPLAGAADSIGVLEIATTLPMDADNLRLVTGVLRLYANFQSLLDYGERDGLTELLNRKTFDGTFMKATIEQRQAKESVQGERRHAEEASGSYWLVMIDIDHFKHVNDNFGHLIGDEVLLLLARLMRAHFRFHDQLYRFGGEEFVVLMRCHGEAEAASVLERLRSTTADHAFPQVGHITISIGFTEVKPGDTPSGAFERADKAVYHAKGHGRNQVCSHAALVTSGDLAEAAANVGDMELF
jgi:diguanylate cyclase (GGDEF)-like protein